MIRGEGKNMIDGILEFLFYAVFPFLKRRKQKREEWTGYLEEIRESRNPVARTWHIAVFRTDEERKVKIYLGEEDSALYKKGIRYRKKAGEDFPEPYL